MDESFAEIITAAPEVRERFLEILAQPSAYPRESLVLALLVTLGVVIVALLVLLVLLRREPTGRDNRE